MAEKERLTKSQQRLLHEMAKDQRVILLQKHRRKWYGVTYALNSFPIRELKATTVAKLASRGFLELNKRGYYVLSTRGQLEASMIDQRKQES